MTLFKSGYHIAFVLILTVTTWLLDRVDPSLNFFPVMVIDAYLILLLVLGAIYSSPSFEGQMCLDIFPTRLVGLIMFFLFFLIMVFSFASLYFNYGDQFEQKIQSWSDAFSYSLGTTTTISIVDFKPASPTTRYIVYFHVFSIVVFFFSAFPLLVSRISSFKG